MPVQCVAIVGHCGFDFGSLSRLARQVAPQAQAVRINDQAALQSVTTPNTLMLVNRALDGRFDVAGSGIELIRSLARHDPPPMMMLVSNYDDAQQQAIAAGALPGFGKSQLGDPATIQRLSKAIAAGD